MKVYPSHIPIETVPGRILFMFFSTSLKDSFPLTNKNLYLSFFLYLPLTSEWLLRGTENVTQTGLLGRRLLCSCKWKVQGEGCSVMRNCSLSIPSLGPTSIVLLRFPIILPLPGAKVPYVLLGLSPRETRKPSFTPTVKQIYYSDPIATLISVNRGIEWSD